MKNLVSLLFVFLALNNIMGQDAVEPLEVKNTVILLNTEPIKVDLASNGEIESIYGIEEGYLDGYNLVKNDYTIDPEIPGAEVEGYKIVFVPVTNLSFDENFATLNSSCIANLDAVIRDIRADREKKIIIKKPVSKNIILNKNRLQAILDYLKVNGVSRGIIDFEDKYDDTDNFEINVVK